MAQPVCVSLKELQEGTLQLSQLDEAFGPSSLGILLVKDLPPRYVELRRTVLSYSSHLASLNASQLAKLEKPDAKYLVGWSLGKETLKSGQFDTLKGSYYVNCAFYQDPVLQNAPSEDFPNFPEYTAPNAWPEENVLPGFQSAVQELCNLIIDTAVLVAQACDKFGDQRIQNYEPGRLEHVVRTSLTTKARLLHYFPNNTSEKNGEDDWCATHKDHGCLTGLTSASYVDESLHSPWGASANAKLPEVLSELSGSPDPEAGLYIHSRQDEVVHVKIPRDCLAFQTGEALEIMTQGKFKAVPHYVKGVGSGHGKIARNTLAVFTQPNLAEIVDQNSGQDFAAFARGVVSRTQPVA